MKKRIRRYAVHFGRATLHVSRWTLYLTLAALVLLAIALTVAHYTLPMIEQRKADLEQYLSNRSGHQVHIESLHAYWDGLHPGAKVTGLQVDAANGIRPAIRLSEVRLSIALLPLLWGKLEINSLVLVHPSLALERQDDGHFRIFGFDPMHTAEYGSGEKFVSWLFQQGRLEIEDGDLQWLDRRDTGAAVHFSRVNLSLYNSGNRHRLGFSAEFPPAMCLDCSLVFDITGNPFSSSSWDGSIFLRAAELNVAALPLIAREKLPPDLRGKFSAQLWSEWEQARPVSVRGNVQVAGLRLPIPGWTAPTEIREADGDVDWTAEDAGWRLDVANALIGLTGPAWPADHLRLVYQTGASQIQIKHVNLDDVTNFIAHIKSGLTDSAGIAPDKPDAWLDYWTAAKPGGTLENFTLHLTGGGDAPTNFALESDIRAAAALPYQKFPGVQGLSGHLAMSRYAGRLQLDSKNLSVSLPDIFRAPLAVQLASGGLSWEKSTDAWQISGADLAVTSADGRGTGKLSVKVPLNKSISPYVKLRVDFSDGNGAHAARYYPAAHLSPATLAWMERSFIAGNITQGYLIYDGPIHDFPFRNGTGKFELRGHVRDAVYQFLPGWEPIKQGDVDVAVNNSEVLVTGTGKIGKLNAPQVVVQSHDTPDGHYVVQVSGKVSGPVGETLNLLRATNPEPGTNRWLAYLPAGLQGSGDGVLSLELTIPLGAAHAVGIDGEYRFMKSSLSFPGTGVSAEAMDGSVHFTEAGIHDATLQARFLGGIMALAATQKNGQLFIQGQGTITAPGLTPMVGAQIAPRLAGSINWNASWRGNQGVGSLRAMADLQNLKIFLPAPLDWPDGLVGQKLMAWTESSTSTGMRLALSVGNHASGQIILARSAAGWSLTGGHIGFGEAHVASPRGHGLQVSARLEALNLDQWFPWLGSGSAAIPQWLSRVNAEVHSLTVFDRNFGNFTGDFSRNQDTWTGTVGGACMTGNVIFSGKGSAARFDLDLARLVLPAKQHDNQNKATDPHLLPTVVLHSRSFDLQNKQLGALDFMATPDPAGWRIERFNLTRPDMKLDVGGYWWSINGKQASQFQIQFNSSDMGKTMTAFDVPDQLAGGIVSVKSNLSWPGSPANFQLATVSGGVEISAKKGRFLQVKPGVRGRLFGLFDLSAISRYLTLDFSPIFGKGLIYDQINGDVTLEQGNAYTHNLTIHGPATQIGVDGRIGLAAEDYDMTIELQPKLSDAVTLASWGVWGPQVAVAVLAVQKIFKKLIAAGTRITYTVKGPWDNPLMTKLQKGANAETSAVPEKSDDATGVR
ncbi:MAG: YhdP family protein [Sulfuricaulis sp.]